MHRDFFTFTSRNSSSVAHRNRNYIILAFVLACGLWDLRHHRDVYAVIFAHKKVICETTTSDRHNGTSLLFVRFLFLYSFIKRLISVRTHTISACLYFFFHPKFIFSILVIFRKYIIFGNRIHAYKSYY